MKFSDHTNIVEVEGITKDAIITKVIIQGGEDRIADYAEREGIALTEEWLLKFGFDKQDGLIKNRIALPGGGNYGFDGAVEFRDEKYNSILLYENEFYYVIDVNDDDYGANYTVRLIKYIHQLQNLFHSLTGEELTIKEKV